MSGLLVALEYDQGGENLLGLRMLLVLIPFSFAETGWRERLSREVRGPPRQETVTFEGVEVWVQRVRPIIVASRAWAGGVIRRREDRKRVGGTCLGRAGNFHGSER